MDVLKNVPKAVGRLHSEMPKCPNRNLEIEISFKPWQNRKIQELDKRSNLDSTPSREMEGKPHTRTLGRWGSRETMYNR